MDEFLSAYAAHSPALSYALALSVLLAFVSAWRRNTHAQESAGRLCTAFGATLLLFSLYPRLWTLSETTFGLFMFEEASASLVYVDRMAHGGRTWTGATQMFYFLAIDAWRWLFGMGVTAARALSAFFGYAAVGFFFLAVARLVNPRAALLAAGLLAASSYATFWSKLVLETGWTLLFFALNLYLYALWRDGWRPRLALFLSGLIGAFGVFTYPGYTIWLLAVTPFLALEIWQARPPLRRAGAALGFILLGFFSFALPSLIFHFVYQDHAPLFKGGGVLLADHVTYASSLGIHLEDLFVIGRSYYLILTHTAFAESVLWGFYLIGAWTLIARDRQPWARVLFGAMWVLIFLSALATNWPGMRRSIVFLGPYYLFSAAGAFEFLRRAGSSLTRRTVSHLLAAAAFLAVMTTAAISSWMMPRLQPFDPFTEAIHHPDFESWLENARVKVFVELPPPNSSFDFVEDYLTSYVRLLQRYRRSELEPAQRFEVQDATHGDFELRLSPGERYLFVFQTPEFLAKLEASGRACVYSPSEIQGSFYRLRRAEVYLKTLQICPTRP